MNLDFILFFLWTFSNFFVSETLNKEDISWLCANPQCSSPISQAKVVRSYKTPDADYKIQVKEGETVDVFRKNKGNDLFYVKAPGKEGVVSSIFLKEIRIINNEVHEYQPNIKPPTEKEGSTINKVLPYYPTSPMNQDTLSNQNSQYAAHNVNSNIGLTDSNEGNKVDTLPNQNINTYSSSTGHISYSDNETDSLNHLNPNNNESIGIQSTPNNNESVEIQPGLTPPPEIPASPSSVGSEVKFGINHTDTIDTPQTGSQHVSENSKLPFSVYVDEEIVVESEDVDEFTYKPDTQGPDAQNSDDNLTIKGNENTKQEAVPTTSESTHFHLHGNLEKTTNNVQQLSDDASKSSSLYPNQNTFPTENNESNGEVDSSSSSHMPHKALNNDQTSTSQKNAFESFSSTPLHDFSSSKPRKFNDLESPNIPEAPTPPFPDTHPPTNTHGLATSDAPKSRDLINDSSTQNSPDSIGSQNIKQDYNESDPSYAPRTHTAGSSVAKEFPTSETQNKPPISHFTNIPPEMKSNVNAFVSDTINDSSNVIVENSSGNVDSGSKLDTPVKSVGETQSTDNPESTFERPPNHNDDLGTSNDKNLNRYSTNQYQSVPEVLPTQNGPASPQSSYSNQYEESRQLDQTIDSPIETSSEPSFTEPPLDNIPRNNLNDNNGPPRDHVVDQPQPTVITPNGIAAESGFTPTESTMVTDEKVNENSDSSSSGGSGEIVTETSDRTNLRTDENYNQKIDINSYTEVYESNSPQTYESIKPQIDDGKDNRQIDENVYTQTEAKDANGGMFSSIYDVLKSAQDMFSNSENLEQPSSTRQTDPIGDDSNVQDFSRNEPSTGESVGELPTHFENDAHHSSYNNEYSHSEDNDPNPSFQNEGSWMSIRTMCLLTFTSAVILVFSLGHYYMENNKRDLEWVTKANELASELFILQKERSLLEEQLLAAQEAVTKTSCDTSKFVNEIDSLNAQLKKIKEEKSQIEEKEQALNKKCVMVETNYNKLRQILSETKQKGERSALIADIKKLKESSTIEIMSLKEQLEIKSEEVRTLTIQLQKTNEGKDRLEEKLNSLMTDEQAAIKHYQDSVAKLEQTIEEGKVTVIKLEDEMGKLKRDCESLKIEKDLAESALQKAHGLKSSESLQDWLSSKEIRLSLAKSEKRIEELNSKLEMLAKEKTDLQEKEILLCNEIEELNDKYEKAEKGKIEALTKLKVLSDYFNEKETQLQEELGTKEALWLQKQSDDHTIYEQMKSLREENQSYKNQIETLRKEIVDQESSYKKLVAAAEEKADGYWVMLRQAERRLKEAQVEAAQLRNRLTAIETSGDHVEEKLNKSHEVNGDMPYVPATSPPFMMYPGDFIPPPPLIGTTPSRPPPLGRISSPPLVDFTPPPPLPLYEHLYLSSSSPPPPPLQYVHKPQPIEGSRKQKDSQSSNHSSESPNDKPTRRNKR